MKAFVLLALLVLEQACKYNQLFHLFHINITLHEHIFVDKCSGSLTANGYVLADLAPHIHQTIQDQAHAGQFRYMKIVTYLEKKHYPTNFYDSKRQPKFCNVARRDGSILSQLTGWRYIE